MNNVNIQPIGAMSVQKADLPLIQVTGDIGFGITATGTVNWLSNIRGTYSQTTGKMTAKFRFQLHITSNSPNFNNNNCKVPPTGFTMASDNTGGAALLWRGRHDRGQQVHRASHSSRTCGDSFSPITPRS